MIAIFDLIKTVFGKRTDDPVHYCDVYKKEGCAHVDGALCDMTTCSTLAAHKDQNIICPVCGYYCLGDGGFGCIDKPNL